MELTRLLYASSLKNSLAVFSVNTLLPKTEVIFDEEPASGMVEAIRLFNALNRSDIVIDF